MTRAARRVFATNGYNAATIADVAHAAGVAIPTVYKLYGNKRAPLSAIADAWWGEFVPQVDVPSDPAEALAWWAATVRRQWETGLDIAMIYAGAVASDPDVRNELKPRLAARDQAIRSICETLHPLLADGLTRDDAAAIISALTLPEVYRDLVHTRGWTPDTYQAWIERTLTLQLLTTLTGHDHQGTRRHPRSSRAKPQREAQQSSGNRSPKQSQQPA